MEKTVYSDFDITLRQNALTNDIVVKKNGESIKQSLNLLLRTRYYGRLWDPQLGSYLFYYLFHQNDEYSKALLEKEIKTLIEKYEPRISLTALYVGYENLIDQDKGNLKILLEYIILESNVSDSFVFAINRIR